MHRTRYQNLKVNIALLERGITQRQLAFDLRVDASHLSKRLSGYEPMSAELKASIAAYLAMPVETLFPSESTERDGVAA